MVGPGGGHNIKRFLDYFNNDAEYQLTYVYFTNPKHYDLNKSYPKISFIPFYHPFILKVLLLKKVDLVWMHNWTPLPFALYLVRRFRRSSHLNFNIWSEPIPHMALEKTLKGKLYQKLFQACDSIQCSWFNTFNLIEKIPNTNPVMLRWGMEEERFIPAKKPFKQETVCFIDELKKSNKVKFFFPKSISGFNSHELVLEACLALKQNGITNFVVYIWPGNHNQESKVAEIKNFIASNGLNDLVIYKNHEFLPDQDLSEIWRNMDCGLQLLSKDQLSTSFQEPLLYRKEIIASNILSYQLFEKTFKVNLKLVNNNKEEVYYRMKLICEGNRTDKIELEKRFQVINEHYRFENNIVKMMGYFKSNILKKKDSIV